MIIGITGTDGAGEKAWDAFARGCQLFSLENSDNLNSSCKERVKVLLPNVIEYAN